MLLHYIPIEEKDARILTKALSRGKFEFHMCKIRVVDNPFLAERVFLGKLVSCRTTSPLGLAATLQTTI